MFKVTATIDGQEIEKTFNSEDETRTYLQSIRPDCFGWQGIDFTDYSWSEWWTNSSIRIVKTSVQIQATLHMNHPLLTVIITHEDGKQTRSHLTVKELGALCQQYGLNHDVSQMEYNCMTQDVTYVYK